MSAAGSARARADAGFTLIEALVTLGVAALVAGIAFPAVERQVREAAFAQASNGAVLALREARADAIRGEREARVLGTARRDGLVRDGARALAVPAGIAVTLPARGIRFYPDGTSSGGSVTIEGPGQRRVIAVDSLSGMAAVR